MKLSFHILNPLVGDGDKCVCGVRLSQGDHRRSAEKPADLTCDRCYLRCLRSWQQIDETIDPSPKSWPGWPWADPRYVAPAEVVDESTPPRVDEPTSPPRPAEWQKADKSSAEFHRHLDRCRQCEQDPMNPCLVGAFLLRQAGADAAAAVALGFNPMATDRERS